MGNVHSNQLCCEPLGFVNFEESQNVNDPEEGNIASILPTKDHSKMDHSDGPANSQNLTARGIKSGYFCGRFFWILSVFLLPILARAGTTDGSVMLLNDSPFILTAIVEASDGTFLGQFSIQPGQQSNFTTNVAPTRYQFPGTPAVSQTPYRVVWQCPSKGFYSMCADVSPGAMCRANGCPGPRFCSPKEEIKDEEPASTLKKKK
jgi:hypothetical protein